MRGQHPVLACSHQLRVLEGSDRSLSPEMKEFNFRVLAAARTRALIPTYRAR